MGGLATASGLPAAGEAQPLQQERTALLVIALEGFRDEEYSAVAAQLQRQGATVVVASTKVGTAQGMIRTRVRVDRDLASAAGKIR